MQMWRGIVCAAVLVASLTLAGLGQVAELQQSVMDVFELAAPAVVHIAVRGTAENFMMQPVPVEGSGSGFLYDTDGHIVTNFHVVEGADEITVSFDQVECCPATVVGLDPSTDLAVIRVQPEDLPEPLRMADSDDIRVGQFVVAIGNPFGLSQTMTFGIVSALVRVIQSPDGRFVGQAIQTDAPINPGNSGGPLLNLQGEVLGVNSQIISPVRGSSGVGFAIPAKTVTLVADALIRDGRFAHPYLGLSGYGLSPEFIQLFRANDVPLPFEEGVMVTRVVAEGPAKQAGMRAAATTLEVGGFDVPIGGDIILSIDDTPVESMLDVILYLDLETRVGDIVILRVLRDGEVVDVPVVIGERPESDS